MDSFRRCRLASAIPCSAPLTSARRAPMTELTRRSLLSAGIAVSAASAFTPFAPAAPAQATASAAGKQAPGFYRYKVGSFECTSINDGARSFPMPEGYIRNVPKEQALAAAEAA